jgi:transposase
MPAKDVKAYLKRNKNDAADAAAICEAVRRPTMRFVRRASTWPRDHFCRSTIAIEADDMERILADIDAHRNNG